MIYRSKKERNFTAMSNFHFYEKGLSWKAKGLMSQILSLPEDWEYSVEGLAALSKDGVNATRTALDELKQFGYVETKQSFDHGKFAGYDYVIYENPQENPTYCQNPHTCFTYAENASTQNTSTQNTSTQNGIQLNTNKSNTKESNTKELNTKKETHPRKAKYGEYGNVLLTGEQHQKLIEEYGNARTELLIQRLDSWFEEKGMAKRYKSHYLSIKRWVVNAVDEDIASGRLKIKEPQYEEMPEGAVPWD